MINLSRVCIDPRLSQKFTIFRKMGEYNEYGEFKQSETEINAIGIVSTAKGKTLEMIPEGDRVTGMMVFITTEPLYQTHNDNYWKGTSDEILWHNVRYRLLEVRDNSAYGFYKGIGTRM